MYVKETPLVPFRNFRSRDNRNEGVHIMGDTQNLADEFGVRLETLIASGSRPENEIVNAADRGQFDLLVLGVQLRPAQRRLFFGPKVEHILRNARCALAVVVTPEIPTAART